MKAIEVYAGSDGELTKALYAELERRGPIGIVAVNLFRASKCSARAKVYRGGVRGRGSYKSMAYDRKNWSLQNLAQALVDYGELLGIPFGWKQDRSQDFHSWVFYVDLPQGQASFHSAQRFAGHDYAGDWCGDHHSAERIIEFCDSLLTASAQQAVSA